MVFLNNDVKFHILSYIFKKETVDYLIQNGYIFYPNLHKYTLSALTLSEKNSNLMLIAKDLLSNGSFDDNYFWICEWSYPNNKIYYRDILMTIIEIQHFDKKINLFSENLLKSKKINLNIRDHNKVNSIGKMIQYHFDHKLIQQFMNKCSLKQLNNTESKHGSYFKQFVKHGNFKLAADILSNPNYNLENDMLYIDNVIESTKYKNTFNNHLLCKIYKIKPFEKQRLNKNSIKFYKDIINKYYKQDIYKFGMFATNFEEYYDYIRFNYFYQLLHNINNINSTNSMNALFMAEQMVNVISYNMTNSDTYMYDDVLVSIKCTLEYLSNNLSNPNISNDLKQAYNAIETKFNKDKLSWFDFTINKYIVYSPNDELFIARLNSDIIVHVFKLILKSKSNILMDHIIKYSLPYYYTTFRSQFTIDLLDECLNFANRICANENTININNVNLIINLFKTINITKNIKFHDHIVLKTFDNKNYEMIKKLIENNLIKINDKWRTHFDMAMKLYQYGYIPKNQVDLVQIIINRPNMIDEFFNENNIGDYNIYICDENRNSFLYYLIKNDHKSYAMIVLNEMDSEIFEHMPVYNFTKQDYKNNLQKNPDSFSNGKEFLIACERGYEEIAFNLITRKLCNLEHLGSNNDSCLIHACRNEWTRIAHLIINSSKCNPYHKNKQNNTALHYAKLNKMTDFVEMIDKLY
jgi:hypothetical protein